MKEQEAAAHLINEYNQSVVVIKTKENILLPVPLRACWVFHISRLLKGKTLNEIDVDSVMLDEMELKNLDHFCNVSLKLFGLVV